MKSQNTLLSPIEIELLKKYKFVNDNVIRKTVDKKNPGHKIILTDVPKKLINELKKIDFDLSHFQVRGSVGEGIMSEVFWVAFLNENYVPKNKVGNLTTQRGIYIVLLFDRELEYAYLAIGNGAEYLNATKLKELSNTQMNIIEKHIDYEGFELNKEFKLYLGRGSRPKNYSKGIPIFKAYKIDKIETDLLIKDFLRLNDKLETIVLNYGLDEIESESQKSNSVTQSISKRKYTAIDVEKYDALRQIREERNKLIGKIAEEYVYRMEKERVSNIDDKLKESVIWKSKKMDGLGYDIESFFGDKTKKFIEVKGTSLDTKNVTFFLSKNELEKAKELRDKYVLILVANVGEGKKPKIIAEIKNPASNVFRDLIPLTFKGVYEQ